MTGNLGMFKNLQCYLGNDAFLSGDVTLHEITHINDTIIGSSDSQIKVKDVLLVSDLAKNLLFVSQLTLDYPYLCEFYRLVFLLRKRRPTTHY